MAPEECGAKQRGADMHQRGINDTTPKEQDNHTNHATPILTSMSAQLNTYGSFLAALSSPPATQFSGSATTPTAGEQGKEAAAVTPTGG